MVMDGNFGISAGIAEMLLQSHEGGIVLLPALPPVWREGSVSGLRARGGFELAIRWKDGLLKEALIYSKLGGRTEVAWDGMKKELELKPGESRSIKESDFKAASN